jgi:ATP-binding cassette subfamily B protein
MAVQKALTPLKKYRAKVILAPILKLVEASIELTVPFLTRFIIDYGISNSDTSAGLAYTLKMGGLILLLAFVAFGATMIAQYLAARVSADYGYELREQLYAHFLSCSEQQVSSFGQGKILTLLNNDASSLQNGVMMFMRLLLRGPFLILGSTILCFIIDPLSGYIYLGAVLASSAIIALVIILSPSRYGAIQSSLDEISLSGSDTLRGSRPIRAFGKEAAEEASFSKQSEKYKDKSMAIAKLNALVNPLTFASINLAMVLIVYFGGNSVNTGSLSKGALVSLMSYLTLSLAALIMFSRLIVSLNKAQASRKRVDAFLALTPSIPEPSKTEITSASSGEIVSFKDVSFAYGSSPKDAISHVSFSLKKGERLGMIGGTGSGKSTTLFLLSRLLLPKKGSISFEGKDINSLPSSFLHSKIAFVSQKPAIFKGTILSNLLLGNPQASDQEIKEALSVSLSDEFVNKYSDGLLHVVEEGGANLSGGQKQRLLIARALLQKADLLVLDDSLSALDFLSEKKLLSALTSQKDLSLLIVSQRIGSLSNCDEVLVYDKGEIVSRGSPEELLKTSPIYKEIHDMQVALR